MIDILQLNGMDMPLEGLEWNEAEVEKNDPLNNGVAMIIAFGKNRQPHPIGTAFIVAASGNTAVAVTAAHNIVGIHEIQSPRPLHQAQNALSEFLPELPPLNLDRKEVRVMCTEGGRVEAAIISKCIWDKKSDLAFLELQAQEATSTFFENYFEIDTGIPGIGDEVCVMGFAGLAVPHAAADGSGSEQFVVSRRLLVRVGKVTEHHMDGHVFCRGPCVETSIPVFSGVSGGLVMRHTPGAKMRPFGIVSSDLEDSLENKYDRTKRGSLIVALLGAKETSENPAQRVLTFDVKSGNFVSVCPVTS